MAKVNFTASRLAAFKCPPEKTQAFLWDSTAPGLGLRATPTGKPAYIFQSEYQGRTLRMTIGGTDARSIPDARVKARELQALIDDGRDPRTVKAEVTAADVAKRELVQSETITVRDAWSHYIAERRSMWGERHYNDHIAKAKAGGVPSIRGTRGRGVTIAGPLYPLMELRLHDLDATTIEKWAAIEATSRPTAARLAWRLLKVFLGWCAEQKEYKLVVPASNPAKTRKSREALGKAQTKNDVLQREQLSAWFDAVRRINNPVVSACLQVILLTGARPGEVITLRWSDVNTKWKGLSIRDKVEGTREIPLTPYISSLLSALPRRSQWIFSGATGEPISSPNQALASAGKVAGIEGLTLHGLRRSFKSLTEWLEIPAGVVAQIMGHKPSATAEKHYTIRPLDLLRLHHEKIEEWILQQAGINGALNTPALRKISNAM